VSMKARFVDQLTGSASHFMPAAAMSAGIS
jgi:hypothetical protein